MRTAAAAIHACAARLICTFSIWLWCMCVSVFSLQWAMSWCQKDTCPPPTPHFWVFLLAAGLSDTAVSMERAVGCGSSLRILFFGRPVWQWRCWNTGNFPLKWQWSRFYLKHPERQTHFLLNFRAFNREMRVHRDNEWQLCLAIYCAQMLSFLTVINSVAPITAAPELRKKNITLINKDVVENLAHRHI